MKKACLISTFLLLLPVLVEASPKKRPPAKRFNTVIHKLAKAEELFTSLSKVKASKNSLSKKGLARAEKDTSNFMKALSVYGKIAKSSKGTWKIFSLYRILGILDGVIHYASQAIANYPSIKLFEQYMIRKAKSAPKKMYEFYGIYLTNKSVRKRVYITMRNGFTKGLKKRICRYQSIKKTIYERLVRTAQISKIRNEWTRKAKKKYSNKIKLCPKAR